MPIARHKCGLATSRIDDEIGRLRKDIGDARQRSELDAHACAAALGDGLRLAGVVAMRRADDPAIRDALRVASRAGAALFAPLSADDHVEVELWEGTARSLAFRSPSRDTDAVNWLSGYCAALALRDRYALSIYGAVPLELLSSVLAPDEIHTLDAAVAFRGYQMRNLQTPSLIAKALRSNDPATLPASRGDWVLDVSVPALGMLYRIVEGREGAFNEDLDKALGIYNRYCARSPERSNDPSHMIALLPLALACRAYDIGIDIFVKSDYIPQFIIEDQSGLEQ